MKIDLKRKSNYLEKIIDYFGIIDLLDFTFDKIGVSYLEIKLKIEKVDNIFFKELEVSDLKNRVFFKKDKVKSCKVFLVYI